MSSYVIPIKTATSKYATDDRLLILSKVSTRVNLANSASTGPVGNSMFCLDCPEYPSNLSAVHWREARLSRDRRLRESCFLLIIYLPSLTSFSVLYSILCLLKAILCLNQSISSLYCGERLRRSKYILLIMISHRLMTGTFTQVRV